MEPDPGLIAWRHAAGYDGPRAIPQREHSMTIETDRQYLERIRQLAAADDREGLDAAISALEPSDAIRAILRLDSADQRSVLTTLSPDEAADLVEDAPDEQAADLIEQLTPTDAAAIVTEMQSDEQADLIADLGRSEAAAILDQMEPEVASEVRALADYPDDVAGGLMITEYLQVSEHATVGETLNALVVNAEDSDDHFSRYVYVLSPLGRLVGVVGCQHARSGTSWPACRRRDAASAVHQRLDRTG